MGFLLRMVESASLSICEGELCSIERVPEDKSLSRTGAGGPLRAWLEARGKGQLRCHCCGHQDKYLQLISNA